MLAPLSVLCDELVPLALCLHIGQSRLREACIPPQLMHSSAQSIGCLAIMCSLSVQNSHLLLSHCCDLSRCDSDEQLVQKVRHGHSSKQEV